MLLCLMQSPLRDTVATGVLSYGTMGGHCMMTHHHDDQGKKETILNVSVPISKWNASAIPTSHTFTIHNKLLLPNAQPECRHSSSRAFGTAQLRPPVADHCWAAVALARMELRGGRLWDRGLDGTRHILEDLLVGVAPKEAAVTPAVPRTTAARNCHRRLLLTVVLGPSGRILVTVRPSKEPNKYNANCFERFEMCTDVWWWRVGPYGFPTATVWCWHRKCRCCRRERAAAECGATSPLDANECWTWWIW